MRKLEERGVAIPWTGAAGVAGEALEGLFVASADPEAGGLVIAPPHPLYGGSMDSPVVSELSWAATKAGLASLRFNWRGVGASSGEPSGEPDAACADYQAALEQLAETVSGPLVAAGYSFGAAAALRAAAASPRVRRLVLVAPYGGVDAAALGERRTLILAGEHDRMSPPEPLEAVAAGAPQVRFVQIEGADHFFGEGLAQLGAAVAEWLQA